jgi:hypothetical protein
LDTGKQQQTLHTLPQGWGMQQQTQHPFCGRDPQGAAAYQPHLLLLLPSCQLQPLRCLRCPALLLQRSRGIPQCCCCQRYLLAQQQQQQQ